MSSFHRLLSALALLLVAVRPADAQPRDIPDSVFVRQNYTKHEYRIAMRDGVHLFTIAYVPNDASATNRYPIVMQRTCYSVGPYGATAYATTLSPDRFMMH